VNLACYPSSITMGNMSTERGNKAETIACEYLQAQGMQILVRNWRNRWSEIDVVAEDNHGTIHVVEVKQRTLANYGSGADYITPDKQHRLKRAALMWVAENAPGDAVQIDVISIVGNDLEYLPNAITD
jgi:putative endonuclease